jgi:hypothetical protein
MRKLYLGLSFVAMVVLMACDGSGTNADGGLSINSSNSSSESDNEYDGEVEYADDLPKCTERKDGKVYYIEDEDITYTCKYDEDEKAGEWVSKKKKTTDDEDDDQESSSSAKKGSVSSSSKKSDGGYDDEVDDDDESNRSIADICADGLSEDCLIGTWTLKSISQKGNGEVITDFSTAPGTMVFNDDGIYRYYRSSISECPTTDGGNWSISEDRKTLTFFENREGDCLEFMKKYTTTPSIEVSGNTVTLKLNKVVFQQDESDGLYAGNDTEVFVRIE